MDRKNENILLTIFLCWFIAFVLIMQGPGTDPITKPPSKASGYILYDTITGVGHKQFNINVPHGMDQWKISWMTAYHDPKNSFFAGLIESENASVRIDGLMNTKILDLKGDITVSIVAFNIVGWKIDISFYY